MKKINNQIRCPWCEGKDISEVARRKDEKKILRCKKCKLMFLESTSSLDLYNEFYFKKESSEEPEIGYVDYQKNSLQNTIWQTLLTSLLSEGRRNLLDLGCATGDFLDVMSRIGFKTTGIEISSWAADIAEKKGLKVYKDSFLNIEIAPESFDIITAWEFIEHVPDIKKTFLKIKNILSPKGLFLFSTPNNNPRQKGWLGPKLSLEHLYYFDTQTLSNAVKEIFKRPPLIFTINNDLTLIGIIDNRGRIQFNSSALKQIVENTYEISIKVNEISCENFLQIEKEISQLRRDIKSLKQSLSWKITKPLRWIGKKIKKILPKNK